MLWAMRWLGCGPDFPTTCKVDCSMKLFPKNEDMKPDLALLLHEQHPRTRAGKQLRAIIEPDSLGG